MLAELRFHSYSRIFPLLEGEEFRQLVEDIAKHGLREPIILAEEEGELRILDGRNRYRACLELGVPVRTIVYDGQDPLAEVVSRNLIRRHLTQGQKAFLALEIKRLEAVRAAERQRATQIKDGKPPVVANLPPPSDTGKSRDFAARVVGVAARYVQSAGKLEEKRPDLAQRVRTGQLSLHAAQRQMLEDERAMNLSRPAELPLPEGIHHGDFRVISERIPDDSIELILTDPPYDEESIALYEDAAKVAARILKPGGSLLAYSGHRHLPRVLDVMSRYLRYWWIIACVHEGGANLMHKLGVRAGWKPIVWFVKGERGDVQNILRDTLHGNREKDLHPWQQAVSEAEYLVSRLCPPNGTVVDFFLGSGTTAMACKRLGRKFVGCESDASAIEATITRLAG